MSKPQLNARVPSDVENAVDQLQIDRHCPSRADATRIAMRAGLAELGYLSGGAGMTPARRIARHVSMVLFYVSATLALISMVEPVMFLFPAIGVMAGSVAVAIVDRYVLRNIEPAVTNKLPRVEVSRRGPAP